MPNKQSKAPNNGAISEEAGAAVVRSCAEMSLRSYVRVIWRRRVFIFCFSVLPTIIAGLVLMFRPQSFMATYMYDFRLDEKGYRLLVGKFYSEENVEALGAQIKAAGLKSYASSLARARDEASLRRLVSFRISPSYIETLSAPKRISVGEVDDIQQVRGTLLTMTVAGRPRPDMDQICKIVRENFEKILPVYSLNQQLKKTISYIKTDMSDIESNRFKLSQLLDRKRATMEKLKAVKPGETARMSEGIVLQFNDVSSSSEFLPLSYQIQALESSIIKLEEEVLQHEEDYVYYSSLLDINARLLAEVKSKRGSGYMIDEYHSFLVDSLKEYEAPELSDYLKAYTKTIENMISASVPIIENPKIYPQARGLVKKMAVIFVALLVTAVFAGFLMEGEASQRP